MLKVFIVTEDEAIRNDLREKVDWGANDCILVGEGNSGEQSYQMIQNLQVDIIFTSLHMKDMDGFEFGHYIKSIMPWTKIILLLDQGEMDSWYESSENEVDGFVKIPLQEESVRRHLQLFLEDFEKTGYSKIYLAKVHENQKIKKQRFFNDMISNQYTVAELLKKSDKLHINLGASAYNVILFKVVVHQLTGLEYSELQIEILTKIEGFIATRPEIIMFDHGRQGFVFLLKEVGEQSIDQLTKLWLDELLHIISQYPEANYFGGIGNVVYCLKDLKYSYEEASRALTYRFIVKNNQFIDSKELEQYLFTDKPEDETTTIDITKLDRDIIEQYLKMGSVSEVKDFIKEYFFSLGENNIRSLIFRQYITMDLYYCALGMIESLGYKKEDFIQSCGDLKQIGKELSTLSGTMDYIERIYTEVITLREECLHKENLMRIKEAKTYIVSHSMEDITLNEIAKAVNTSPYYLSNLFYTLARRTWIDELNLVRIHHAKKLISEGMDDLTEVAHAVGYEDIEDFDYYMKKYGHSFEHYYDVD